ncbi:C45 family peptidase [Pseudoroseomonas cervicalis]|uniref:C45 family autoproteolytic acyltransferase/hydolase n=1 Tax=Teichococcus cervicalis TaxID=204525 RepID=UPI0022F1DA14|nr:C45 family peptidase [Pseudoroseomonas cervicalis]WBV45012.1 C45 family autoproteolytic acyltransferase/hydrolase [Pseudoroseomonas cervicalis]
MSSIEPFPLIELSGTPEARGRAYGRQAAARVHRSLAHYGQQLTAGGQDAATVRAMARDFVPQVEAFDPAYVAEMRGIAEGANVAFEDILLINCRTEILQLAKRRADRMREEEARNPDGCTGAILLPSVTQDGRLVHGQNWDWKQECAETGVVLRIRREDGPDMLTFVEAGGLARCGMNAAGIAVTANYLSSDRDYTREGVPLSLLRRKVLEQEQVALALRTLYATPKSASNNLMLSHVDGFALDIECAPDESFLVQPEAGMLVHANHWQSPVALSKLREAGVESTPDSLYRDLRVRQILESHRGALGIEAMREALFDDWQSPWSVCRPPRMNLGGNLSATVAMILMVPAEGRMEIAPLPALNRHFTRYDLQPGRAAVAA